MPRTRTRTPAALGVSIAVFNALLAVAPALAQAEPEANGLPTIESKTEGMRHLEGYFDLYWDEPEGKLYLEIHRWGTEFLHQVSLPTGLGSNPVGLDRGQLGGTYVLTAQRVGPRVLLTEPNYGYRALSEDPNEVKAVREAFASSTHWGFKVIAETGDRVLVDATDFFVRDAHGVAQRLKQARQGTYRLDASRSVVYLPRTRAFPENTEVEVSLTFTSDEPGPLVRQTAASGGAVTFRQHHSLVRLPDAGYRPREVDPRVGAFGISFHDYATPIDEPLVVQWVARHRLEKRDPAADRSEPVEPIVYYLDPGVPEPIRGALLEGASWWNQAFEAAGFIDAFRVEMLPDGADPMDLRYNMIHWTHRSTRGWSYGSTVVDPRTGEILKGNVNLGSLRLRQDHLLGVGMGLVGAEGGTGATRTAFTDPGQEWFGTCDMAAGPGYGYLSALAANGNAVQMALARVRQLSAHEVGHTLGLAHNFIASAYGRTSVMDYPAPLARITGGGEIDLSDAYAVGIGEYDKFAITWLYSHFGSSVDEAAALHGIIRDGLDRGIRFISDADARSPGAAHPLAHLWDNGADPIQALRTQIAVRGIGLDRFGEESIRSGQPLASLEGVLVPLYLHHRYQTQAAVRSVGGVDYNYAVRGDGQRVMEVVMPETQREALEAVLETIDPDFLALPESILALIPPRSFGMPAQERFASGTSPTFDPQAVAASAAQHTAALILQPQRMARLIDFHNRNVAYPGLEEVVDRLLAVTWGSALPADSYRAEVARTARRVVLDRMISEAGSGRNAASVRAVLSARLDALAARLEADPGGAPETVLAAEDIRRWQKRPYNPEELSLPSNLPPGDPIGADGGGR